MPAQSTFEQMMRWPVSEHPGQTWLKGKDEKLSWAERFSASRSSRHLVTPATWDREHAGYEVRRV